VAHVSLKGQVKAERFVEGELMQISAVTAGLYRTPNGPLDRELLFGQSFLVLDSMSEEDMRFGVSQRDGYCGWVDAQSLGTCQPNTHKVAVRESYMQTNPDLKAMQARYPLFLGSEVAIREKQGAWCGCLSGKGEIWFVPSCHLAATSAFLSNVVDVARMFLGTPYVWGGNTGRGIDCSGLIQAAFLACGVDCPGDSDLQMKIAGEALDESALLQAADLLFWKGHVAMATGPDAMIHANAHHMAVVEEPIAPALERIAASDTGPATLRLRPNLSRE
jgi:cell wall-associated NlpC family hydrolase